MDYNSATSQLVVAGRTFDDGISNLQASPFPYIPIIVSYQGASFDYLWGIYIVTLGTLRSISISSDGSIVIGQLGVGLILVIQAKDGSLKKAITSSFNF